MKGVLRHIVIAVLLQPLLVQAQQEGLHTQYMFNLFDVSAASVTDGRQHALALRMRRQWTGIEGSPTSLMASFKSPGREKKLSWGVRLGKDQIGARRNYDLNGVIGKSVRLNETQYLSFALQLGLINESFMSEEIFARDVADPLLAQYAGNYWGFNAGGGLYWRSRTSFIGLDFSRITGGMESTSSAGRQVIHSRLVAGHAFEVSESWMLRPSGILRNAASLPPQWELQVAALYAGRLWLGAGYRSGFGIVSYMEYAISPRWRLGYSYDLPVALPAAFGGSHELFMGIQWPSQGPIQPNLRLF